MSVLTVSGSAALPDRTLQYPRTASFTSQEPHPPPSPGRVHPSSYSRQMASYSQQGAPVYHRHSRTVSSALLPGDIPTSGPNLVFPNHSRMSQQFANPAHSRQSSTSTFTAMQQQPTGTSLANSTPRRSTSSRSAGTNAPVSYVTLMRKQKATVWCDRSQSIDPRLAAAQRVAKHRAAMQVNGSISHAGRTSTITSGGVVGKIRHGGVPKAPGYSTANMTGAGVPMRLSANEMLGDEEDARSFGVADGMAHGRSGSGKSSSSSKFRSGYPRPEGKFSGSNTPPLDLRSSSKDEIPELAENERPTTIPTPKRSGSEDSFGDIKELGGPSALQHAMEDAKKNEDLRRRGSVDERTMSMGAGVRLFVANPDLDD